MQNVAPKMVRAEAALLAGGSREGRIGGHNPAHPGKEIQTVLEGTCSVPLIFEAQTLT